MTELSGAAVSVVFTRWIRFLTVCVCVCVCVCMSCMVHKGPQESITDGNDGGMS